MALAAASLLVMPWLARAKRQVAPVLGSQAQAAEADQTALCALLSAVLLVGCSPTPPSAGGGPTPWPPSASPPSPPGPP